MEILLETLYFSMILGNDGILKAFINKEDGVNYCRNNRPFSHVSKNNKEFSATKATISGHDICLEYGDSGITAVVRTDVTDSFMALEVLNISDADIDRLTFADAVLDIDNVRKSSFAVSCLALNLMTDVKEIPGLNNTLRAYCYPRFGIAGAKAAIIGCSPDKMREVMKNTLTSSDGIPKSMLGGPWALDSEVNRYSYIIELGELSSGDADRWIGFYKKLGIRQVNFHGGKSFRFGDFAVNRSLYPDGTDSLKTVIDRLHECGIQAGLHTYAFFMDKASHYVTPVPDRRLGVQRVFTLAGTVDEACTGLPVLEPTKDVSPETGFFIRNSATLRIDDELIVFAGCSDEYPYGFLSCERGALGTKKQKHLKGAKVYHLKECFGLFTPDADSGLLEEIAANTAFLCNVCGFDCIYLDALDGEDILGGEENAWHYGSKFVFDICKGLKKPAVIEMSTFHHHLWYVRSRIGAWDHPVRYYKQFIDRHSHVNTVDTSRTMLPGQLGWWSVKAWEGNETERTFTDDIEYLCCKSLGNNTGFSIMGLNPGNIETPGIFADSCRIIRQYEELRYSGCFGESVKEKLRAPGEEYSLRSDGNGGWYFRHVEHMKHRAVCPVEAGTTWTVENRFDRQPLKIRIEALLAAGPFDSEDAVILLDACETSSDGKLGRECAEGVRTFVNKTNKGTDRRFDTFTFGADNRNSYGNGAWANIFRKFDPPIDLGNNRALGVWICGDGMGEIVNVRVKNPKLVTEALGEHFIKIDFTGWKYFELVENESGADNGLIWPYTCKPYTESSDQSCAVDVYSYREEVDYKRIETASIWYNNIPGHGHVECVFSPVRAIPLVRNSIKNPSVEVCGKRITFLTELESGCCLEYSPGEGCRLYGKAGELTDKAQVKHDDGVPEILAGRNIVSLSCEKTLNKASLRANVTVIAEGDRVD